MLGNVFSVTVGKMQYTHKVVNKTFSLQIDRAFQGDVLRYECVCLGSQTCLEAPKMETKPLSAAKHMAAETKDNLKRDSTKCIEIQWEKSWK